MTSSIDPPFPHAKAGAFLALAAVGALFVFSSTEAELKGVAHIGLVMGGIGVLGAFRLVQRQFLLIFNPRWKRLADVTVVTIGLGLFMFLWSSWQPSPVLQVVATWLWRLGIAVVCASIGLTAVGIVTQVRVALHRTRQR